jgi:hypothetical protein
MVSIAERRAPSDGEGCLLRFRRRSDQVHNQAELSLGPILLTSASSTTRFRKLLSKERNPPIERVIETGVVSRKFICRLSLRYPVKSTNHPFRIRRVSPLPSHSRAVRSCLGPHKHC